MPTIQASIWESIQFVSGGFTLAAFIAAVIFWALKSKMDERERLIRTAKQEQRAGLVARALETFAVETGGLTRQQQYDLAMAQIAERSHRFRVASSVIALAALLLAAVTAYAISMAKVEVPPPITEPAANAAVPAAPTSIATSPHSASRPSLPEAPLAGCPGNLLAGEHRPRGAATWFWNLDLRSGAVRIFKPDHSVTGRVEMSCIGGRWTARLFEMTHGLLYNCAGDIEAGHLRNATCLAPGSSIIDVTGTFSTAAN